MSSRLGWKTPLALCCAVLLMIFSAPGAADAARNLLIQIEDGDGNPIYDAQVMVMTQDGDWLKTIQGSNGITAPYALEGKITIEIEHELFGRKYVELNLDDPAPAGEPLPDGAPVVKTVVLGPDLREQASTLPPPETPANDLCANAIPLLVPSVTLGSTLNATVEEELDGTTCGTFINSPGVWYSVIGTGTEFTASTCGGFYDYDTKISVFCGSCDDLACIDGNDDNCAGGASGLLSTVSWCAQSGAEYLILVHGFAGQTGDFELTLSEGDPPCVPDVACLPMGACCLPDGSCAGGLTEAECAAQGGLYQGDDTDCAGFVSWSFEYCANAFEDISGSGTPLVLSDDDGQEVPIGFDFNFWGNIHGTIWVSSNGYLTFGPDVVDFSNDAIPNTNDPNDLIAPLWDDLDPGNAGSPATVHYQTLGAAPNRHFIAQWTNVPQFPNTGSNTFQAILFEGTNCIEFRYGAIDPPDPASDYTVGIESPDGTEGVAEQGDVPAEGVCISFCPELVNPIACVIDVHLDIKPTSCPNPLNTKSKGVLPVAILGTAEFDVTTIDPATIRLEGVAPLRWNVDDVGTPFEGELCDCHELGGDGILDLTLKFKTQDIVAAINGGAGAINAPSGLSADGSLLLNSFEELILTLTGSNTDGLPIIGSDCVRIMHHSTGPWPDGDPSDPGAFSETIKEISLGHSYPNPFTSETRIGFSLPEPTHVSLVVYDVAGRRMKTLVNEEMPGGHHFAAWNRTNEAGRPLPAGVYFVRMSAQGFDRMTKLIVAQ